MKSCSGLAKATASIVGAVAISSFKALLVASIYMHPNHERRMIYVLIAFALLHAMGCFLGTYLHLGHPVGDPNFYKGWDPPANLESRSENLSKVS